MYPALKNAAIGYQMITIKSLLFLCAYNINVFVNTKELDFHYTMIITKCTFYGVLFFYLCP